MRLLVALLVWFLRAVPVSRRALALENLALRQQLATYARGQKRPRLKLEERAFWVALSTIWQDWRSLLVFVKPATVVDWHRRGFRRYRRWRSRKPGRPRIPDEHIAFIRRISQDHSAGMARNPKGDPFLPALMLVCGGGGPSPAPAATRGLPLLAA